MNEGQRPDPDALLAQMQASERRAARGRLRVYFGASAGVGKTCAMLTAARALVGQGMAVLAGVVETHGRRETAALLADLPLLPPKQVPYRDRVLPEFDLDEALRRRPALVLVDELAHTNAPGARHPKRWQDVFELLDAGIDVFTTVNVQHLESLNDIVGGITGVKVHETVPDTVFERADEVVLVDVSADELLARLMDGKVYGLDQASRAARNFFRKGNLIALRELALRHMADRLHGDVQAYRVEQSIDSLWKTGAVLLACVGARDGGEHIVRSAARLAAQLNGRWHAVYVETPALQKLPDGERERILRTLKLAQDLGATTAVLADSDVPAAIARYAQAQNIARIVVGRGSGSLWHRPMARRLAAAAPAVDLIETAAQNPGQTPVLKTPGKNGDRPHFSGNVPWLHYAIAAGASCALAVAMQPFSGVLENTNIAMVFLLAVLLVAYRFGRGPALLSSVTGVAAFDFLFVAPTFSFAVSDVQYLITFAVMLATGLVTSHLTAGLRFQARVASHRELRARALYEFARELTGVLQAEQVFDITSRTLAGAFRARVTLLLPDEHGQLQAPDSDVDPAIAQWAFDHAEAAGFGTGTLPSSPVFYLPLTAPMRTRGVLALLPDDRRWLLVPEQRRQLDTFAALAAIALERVHYIDVAQGALVQMASERLRNSLLAALSHDLRTPLTSLVGLAESLARSKPALAPSQLELAEALRQESLRLSTMVANLLDMARIESGAVQLKLQWQALEEVVGSALRASRQTLREHQVVTRLPADLPLVRYDAVLIERVLCNLLENAVKYTPAGSTIALGAATAGTMLRVTVSDNGPGLPAGQEEAIFEKFTRGENESARPGVGLGLSICRAVVAAHGGTIGASTAPEGGAAVTFTLPLGTPPAPPEELDHE